MHKLLKGLQQVMLIETCFVFINFSEHNQTNFLNYRSFILRQILCNAESVSKPLCLISIQFGILVFCPMLMICIMVLF